MPLALTRPVPPAIVRCELTHLERSPIDVALAAEQHGEYERALESLGCVVQRVAEAPDLPDSVFVEDTAIVLDEIAVITRPGAESRRAETASVAVALEPYRTCHTLRTPALMDGGDVLRLGKRIFVGISSRTSEEGARQLARIAEPFGYTVRCIHVRRCLHLKSAVTGLGDDRLLHNPQWVDARLFDDVDLMSVPPEEPYAANVLAIGRGVIVSSVHVRTADMLTRAGYDVRPVDVSELAKAEAGVTCCSVIVK